MNLQVTTTKFNICLALDSFLSTFIDLICLERRWTLRGMRKATGKRRHLTCRQSVDDYVIGITIFKKSNHQSLF